HVTESLQLEHLSELFPAVRRLQVGFPCVVDDDFHAWKSAPPLPKSRLFMRRDVKVKDGAQLLRFTPQRVVLLGVQPGRLWMVDRAETHSLKAVLIHPKPQFLGDLGINRIDQPVSAEKLR